MNTDDLRISVVSVSIRVYLAWSGSKDDGTGSVLVRVSRFNSDIARVPFGISAILTCNMNYNVLYEPIRGSALRGEKILVKQATRKPAAKKKAPAKKAAKKPAKKAAKKAAKKPAKKVAKKSAKKAAKKPAKKAAKKTAKKAATKRAPAKKKAATRRPATRRTSPKRK